ncbi:2-oxo acid dehydrogenase subunit E2 [Nocardioides sp.]|uniref:2-oxo acid dehydrogenase subunit E2 n=1 Tax=Nocardioides sp. TaxID=35761 RepID=UPI003D12FA89
MRRVIGRRMRDSMTSKPHVTLHGQAECSGLVEMCLLEQISLTAGLVSVVGRVLSEHPELNAWLVDDRLIECDSIDVGVAVDIPGGLVVPVIRAVDQLAPAEVAERLSDLARRARAQELGTEDVVDATFTVSTLGSLGVQYFTPIISPPQVAILGVGTLESRLTLDVGSLREEQVLSMSLSFDHAALDGVPAARFLKALSSAVKDAAQGASERRHQEVP